MTKINTIIRQIPIGVFQTVLVTLGHDPNPTKEQKMIRIGDISFTKPYQGKIEKDQVYYFPSIDISALFGSMHWTGSERDHRIMKKGLLHLSKENAIAHAKALIKLSGGEICQR